MTVRAETSRLRRIVGGLLLQRPYRLADWVDVRVRFPAAGEDILPASTAAAVRDIRTQHAFDAGDDHTAVADVEGQADR